MKIHVLPINNVIQKQQGDTNIPYYMYSKHGNLALDIWVPVEQKLIQFHHIVIAEMGQKGRTIQGIKGHVCTALRLMKDKVTRGQHTGSLNDGRLSTQPGTEQIETPPTTNDNGGTGGTEPIRKRLD